MVAWITRGESDVFCLQGLLFFSDMAVFLRKGLRAGWSCVIITKPLVMVDQRFGLEATQL